MQHSILNPEYEARFVDTSVFPPSTPFLLRGLAAALQDSGSMWFPTVSELASILQDAPSRDDLVACGASYGVAKSAQGAYPGPALLLYGAIVNRLFQAENSELNEVLARVEQKIENAGLATDKDIIDTLNAARDRARMGRVSRLMRNGFAEGLRMSTRYADDQVDDLAHRIVDTTHDVRHRALIDRVAWLDVDPGLSGNYYIDYRRIEEFGSTDPFQEAPPRPATRAGLSFFQQLVPHAQIACAYLLARRLDDLRG